MILTTISLDSIKQSPSSAFYRLLCQYARPVFQPKDEIVLQNFAELSTAFLANVMQVIDFLDISPCFIRIQTNQPLTHEYFVKNGRDIRIDWTDGIAAAPLEHKQPVFNTDGQMCCHAWSGFHINTDGSLKVCCDFSDLIKDTTGKAMNIRKDNVDQIINSDYMIKIRQQFRAGETPQACAKCQHYEQHSGVSKRSLSRFKLDNLYSDVDWENDIIIDKNLFIGGHLGNLCNLKCRICNERSSSQIALEKMRIARGREFHGKTNIMRSHIMDLNWKKTDPHFWQRLQELVPRVRNFELLGGEPLMLSENLAFMQHLVDSGHSHDCVFEFVTNGTHYPDVFDDAHKFRRLTVTVSIDDIGPRFEYQRKNASWTVLENNLARFVQARDRSRGKMEIGVSITVNIQNVLYLPELLAWLDRQHVSHYFLNVLDGPRYLSIHDLTPAAKQLVIDRLSTADLTTLHRDRLMPLMTLLASSTTSDGKEFCRFTQSLDRLRGENFANHHSEIANAMGYVLH